MTQDLCSSFAELFFAEPLLGFEVGRVLSPDNGLALGVDDLNLCDGEDAEEDIVLVRGKRWLIAAGFHKGLDEWPATTVKGLAVFQEALGQQMAWLIAAYCCSMGICSPGGCIQCGTWPCS